jgi:hypothetical protein
MFPVVRPRSTRQLSLGCVLVADGFYHRDVLFAIQKCLLMSMMTGILP